MWMLRVSAPSVALGVLALCALGQTYGQATTAAAQAKPTVQKKQKSEAPPAMELKSGPTINFSLPAPTYVVSWIHCDNHGNIYLIHSGALPRPGRVPATGPSASAMRLTKLSLDSQEAINYRVQEVNGDRTFWRNGFTVDSWGNVYALYGTRHSPPYSDEGIPQFDNFVLKFDSAGNAGTTTRLQNPSAGKIAPMHFAVFGDGSLIVTGMLVSRQPDHPFTGIFDSRGRFVEELSLPDDVRYAASTSTAAGGGKQGGDREKQEYPLKPRPGSRTFMAVNFSLLVPGPGNAVYLLRASNPPILYTLSSDGRVMHEARIVPPMKYARPSNMTLAGPSDLLIEFYGQRVDKQKGTTGARFTCWSTQAPAGRSPRTS